jgi:hypothetical protein
MDLLGIMGGGFLGEILGNYQTKKYWALNPYDHIGNFVLQ